MPYIQQISKTLQHTYRAGWAHMNPSKAIADIKVLAPKVLHKDCETLQVLTHIEVKNTYGHVKFADVKQAIRDTFGGSSCRHEHDCCGCWSASIYDIRRTGRWTFCFVVSASRNY
jgi:hypothetical protein